MCLASKAIGKEQQNSFIRNGKKTSKILFKEQ